MLGQFGFVFVFSVREGLGVVVESFEVTFALSVINVAIIFCCYGCFIYQALLLAVSIH